MVSERRGRSLRSARHTGFGIVALAALVAGMAVAGTSVTATTPAESLVRSVATSPAASQTPAASTTDPHRALVTTYCLSCHTQQQKARGAVLNRTGNPGERMN